MILPVPTTYVFENDNSSIDIMILFIRLQRLNELNVRTLDKKPMTRVENIEELIKKGMSEAEIEVVFLMFFLLINEPDY